MAVGVHDSNSVAVRILKGAKTVAGGSSSATNQCQPELSSLTRRCVAGRRYGDVRSLRADTKAWSSDVNGAQPGVDWQMKIGDARCKLASVYPKIRL
jgi:hypothetical protein